MYQFIVTIIFRIYVGLLCKQSCVMPLVLFFVLNPSLHPSDLTVRMYVNLIKSVLYSCSRLFDIEPEELQWKTLISSFVDSQWLLDTHSEENTVDKEIRAALDAVKKESRLSNGL